MQYNVHAIEKKWQKRWHEHPVGMTRPTGDGKKFYCLDMFPYPSGSGLHVGHWRGYVLSDVYTRVKWLEGYNILHPMGWDAFGLPAENDAIKKGIHPAISTAKNVAHFKEQLQEVAALYDWSKELNTTDPEYYKWTQWIFLQMYKAGLAYQDNMPINWCPSCLTGLANEEVVNGGCERCGSVVEKRSIRQWVLRITEYAEKLLSGLDKLEWPEKVKLMQRNWIGKSEGAQVVFSLAHDEEHELEVFTTCPHTLFGVTFLAVAHDHALIEKLVKPEHVQELEIFRQKIDSANDQKYGFFTGSYVKHPLSNALIPVWVANYVLSDYGTGAVMGVPGHDERDNEFARLYQLPIVYVIDTPELQAQKLGVQGCYPHESGILMQSGSCSGLSVEEGRACIIKQLEQLNKGSQKTTYKLRDWIFSRQRYWGEPIPLVHCPKDGVVPVPESELPIRLPDVERYEPTGTGESPLAGIHDWVNTTCPKCGGPAQRETNTMPQWAGSCWYFLRYPNPQLAHKPFDEKDMDYWLPVDLYVGGIEHAILHLLYARFYVKVLYDLGYLKFDEPFTHLFNQGMVCKYSEKSGLVEKMSKSKGNVVNPDDIVKSYGSDALRMYILFMGPPELDCEWQDSGLEGIKRFLNRFWNYCTDPKTLLAGGEAEQEAVTRRVHKLLKDVQDRLALFKPNTAIAAFMEWLNDMTEQNARMSKASLEAVLVTLSTMAPHMMSELVEALLGKQLEACSWPVYNPALAAETTMTIPVQVNGKLRAVLTMSLKASREEIEAEALQAAASWLEGKEIVKVVYAPCKLISFVVK